jgi:hypothetical protein
MQSEQFRGFWWESKKVKGTWEDQDVGRWIVLKRVLDRIGWYGLD